MQPAWQGGEVEDIVGTAHRVVGNAFTATPGVAGGIEGGGGGGGEGSEEVIGHIDAGKGGGGAVYEHGETAEQAEERADYEHLRAWRGVGTSNG